MTTLQEACVKALDVLENGNRAPITTAANILRTALAQQGERKNCPQPEICGSKECEFCRDTAAPTHERVYETIIQWDEGGGKRSRRELTRRIEALYTAAPAPHPAQPLLAHEVLKLNVLWNKSSVKDSAIADQLAVCRVLADSEDDMKLTDAQILTLWEETYVQRGWTGIEFARAIERAHGIGVKQ